MIAQNLTKSRIAISAAYFSSGLIFASWASRIPDVKNLLHLTDGNLGKILLAIPTGQLAMMLISGYLVTKLGSRMILPLSLVLYTIALISIAIPNQVETIFLSLLFFGAAANMVNIALNTQACKLEILYEKNIMASFHGLWSLGGFLGGIIGTVLVKAGYSMLTHFVLMSFLCILIALISSKYLILDKRSKEVANDKNEKSSIKLNLYLIILGLIGFAGMFCEGTMYDWSSVYFETIIKPDESLIRIGYIASMGTMTLGRFIADKFVFKFKAPIILIACGILITSGLLLSTLLPHLVTSTVGFMLVGLGVSSVVPICYSESGKSSTVSASVAITIVSSISFIGFMIGPPLIGLLSEITNLRIALAIASSFGLLIAFLAKKSQSIKENL